MSAYIVRRLGQALLVILGVSLIVFLITKLLPGGPARAILGPRATQGQIHVFLVANGYTKPIFAQYFDYVSRFFHGDLGFSYHSNQSVGLLLSQNLPKSALLIGLAYVAALVVAVPIGIFQAVKRNKPVDYLFTGVAFIGYSMPLFWLGIILILLFSVTLHVFPPGAPQGATVGAVLQQPSALVLPVATLAIVTIALFSRFVRSSAIENLTLDYVRTARAKGVPERRILFGHVLRNSLIPIITLLGLSLPVMISGAVIVEAVFNYPGMGLLFWTAATTQDYPVLMGFTIVVAAATVLGSLIADLLYAVADPRVRLA